MDRMGLPMNPVHYRAVRRCWVAGTVAIVLLAGIALSYVVAPAPDPPAKGGRHFQMWCQDPARYGIRVLCDGTARPY